MMNTRDGATTLRRVSSLPFQRLNDETLVVDPRTREVHLLNASASRIWDLLDAPRTSAELLSVLGTEFDAPADVMRADVEALLDELDRKGLIGHDARVAPDHDGDTEPRR